MRNLVFPAFAILATAIAQAPPPEPPNRPELAKAAAAIVFDLQLEGAALSVVNGDKPVHRSAHGQFTSEHVIPIASASKWLAVAAVLALVDDGLLDLDVPVARYLPQFDRPDKRTITLRHCLACTAGFGAERVALLGRRQQTMADLAAAMAELTLHSQPGAAFRYSGVGFQVAACAAEKVAQRTWHELFSERIAGPLGMTQTRFGRLLPAGGEAGTTPVPWVAGGAVSSLVDYERFVVMLLERGECAGRRVLSAASVAAMLSLQTGELEVRLDGVLEGQGVHYGLGTWITGEAGGVVRCSDPGAFGFIPWVDPDLGVGGVFAVRDRVARVLPRVRQLQDLARAAVRSEAVAGRTETVVLDHQGRERRYRMWVPAAAGGTQGLPLLLLLHGGGGNGEQVAESTGMPQLAAREGFVLVCPDGTGPLRNRLLTWNSGGIDVYASEHEVDDVGFLKAVVTDVSRRVAIDPTRVCAAGHSNGAMMCHRLAREAGDVFAAVVSVAGAMDFTAVDPGGPIHVLIVHGTADDHVPFEGGRPRKSVGRAGSRTDASVADAVTYYRARNGLAGQPESIVDGKVRTETWERTIPGSGGSVRLRLITLTGGGHAWPGGSVRIGADTPFPFDASRAVVDFCRDARRLATPAAAPR